MEIEIGQGLTSH